MLWCSAPTSLNTDLLNDGVILAQYKESINLAIKGSFIVLFRRKNTLRCCFLRVQCVSMTGMLDWACAPEREMKRYCLRVKTMDRTLNFSEAFAHRVRRCHLGTKNKMGRRSLSSSSSQQRKTRRKNITLLKQAMSSQRSSSCSLTLWCGNGNRWPGEWRWKEVTKVFSEAGVQIKERKTFWCQKREDELVQQTAELLAATRIDTVMKAKQQDCFDTLGSQLR